MKSIKLSYIMWIIILIVLIGVTRAWSNEKLSAIITNSWIWTIWFIGLIWLNIIVNRERVDDRLIAEDKLLSYPRYKLMLAGVWIIAAMRYIADPFAKLTAAFAVSSICLWRDHRWSAFLALDMLVIIIVMLLLNEQTIADSAAIYLYYFLVIATVTMIINHKNSLSEDKEVVATEKMKHWEIQ